MKLLGVFLLTSIGVAVATSSCSSSPSAENRAPASTQQVQLASHLAELNRYTEWDFDDVLANLVQFHLVDRAVVVSDAKLYLKRAKEFRASAQAKISDKKKAAVLKRFTAQARESIQLQTEYIPDLLLAGVHGAFDRVSACIQKKDFVCADQEAKAVETRAERVLKRLEG